MARKLTGRCRRKRRIRKKMVGTPERPRMSVFRSVKNISVQIIDDVTGSTIVAASTYEKDFKGKAGAGNKQGAKIIGAMIAERALAKGVSKVVFDRNGCLYHGRVKELAESARQKGLKF